MMLNAYERKREERIARNREILAQLVANNPLHRALQACAGAPASAATAPHAGKRQRAVVSLDTSLLRRSSRVQHLPAPIYTTFDYDDDLGDAAGDGEQQDRKRRGVIRPSDTTPSSSPPSSSRASKPTTSAAAPLAANAIRALDARLDACYASHLGLPIVPIAGSGAMKQTVIDVLSPVPHPRFSKYSGIQEWRNAVCLFINVGDKHGNSYDNVFSRAGGRISWFAQPRQDQDTPVIRRITSTATLRACDALTPPPATDDVDDHGDDTGAGASSWPLHLFSRMEGAAYVYCGRLRCESFNPQTCPMRFELKLLDAPLLRASDYFLGLVELADADVVS